MEIHSLKLVVTEEDINVVVARILAEEPQVRDIRVALTAQGIRIAGVYPTAFLSVRFETLWSVSAHQGRVVARLADLKAGGLPVGMLRGTILSTLAETFARGDYFCIEGDTLSLDPDRMLAHNGFTGHFNLKTIRCEPGRMVFEAGAS
jgi:hypothetical protein